MTQWGVAPVIIVFADTAEGVAAASSGAEAAGARVAAALPIDQALDRLDIQVAVDLIMLDVAMDHGPRLDRVLRRIERGVRDDEFTAVLTIAPDLLDIVAAQIDHQAISLLVGRDPRTLEVALTERLRRTVLQLREENRESSMGASHVMGRGAESREIASPSSASSSPESGLRPSDAMVIRDIIRARRLREELFGVGLFADPAWDILLDLTAARIEGRSVAVSSLCIAAAVPATTALRWIKQLTEAGLLHRVADPDDGRRVFIELTDRAAAAMTAYFASVPGGVRS